MSGSDPIIHPAIPPTRPRMPLIVEADVMQAALRSGEATTLSPLVTGLVHYQDLWWIDTIDAWAQITDPTFAAQLQSRHRRGTWG